MYGGPVGHNTWNLHNKISTTETSHNKASPSVLCNRMEQNPILRCFMTRHLKNLVLRSWKYKTWCNLPSHRAQWVQRQHCHVSINICGFFCGGGKTLVHFLQSPNYILPFVVNHRESVCKRIWGSHSRLHWDNDDFHLCWCCLLLLPTSVLNVTLMNTDKLIIYLLVVNQKGVCLKKTPLFRPILAPLFMFSHHLLFSQC